MPQPAPARPGARPNTVTLAAGAMMLAVLITVGMVVVTIANMTSVLNKFSDIPQSTVDTIEPLFKGVEIASIVVYMLFAVAVALLALGNLRGKRGTWIATFVVSGLFVLCGFCGMLSNGTGGNFGGSANANGLNTNDLLPDWSYPVTMVLDVLLIAAHAAAIVLLAVRPSSAFFNANRKSPTADPGYPGMPAGPGMPPAGPAPGYGVPGQPPAGPGYGQGPEATTYGTGPIGGPSYGTDPGPGPTSGPGYGAPGQPPTSGPGYGPGQPPASGPGPGGPGQPGW